MFIEQQGTCEIYILYIVVGSRIAVVRLQFLLVVRLLEIQMAYSTFADKVHLPAEMDEIWLGYTKLLSILLKKRH